MRFGGIDLGGTKIEARLFEGADARTVETRRAPTPLESFEALIGGLADAVAWLEERGGGGIPIGLAVPGAIDPGTGRLEAVNLPRGGRPLAAEIERVCGRPIQAIPHDAMAFAVSEARGGAADGERCVAGLILGTGLGAGFCIDGHVPPRASGLAVEIGHVGVPAAALSRHDLPLWPCACGRAGCFEAYVAGPGLARLAAHRLGRPVAPPDLAAATGGSDVLAIWFDIVAEALRVIQITLDPGTVVLGGGLSNLPDMEARLAGAFAARAMGTGRPAIRRAAHGDSSGARGAGLIAASISRA